MRHNLKSHTTPLNSSLPCMLPLARACIVAWERTLLLFMSDAYIVVCGRILLLYMCPRMGSRDHELLGLEAFHY